MTEPALIVAVRVVWDHTALPLPPLFGFHTLHVGPEPGHPFGRKGLAFAAAWRTMADDDARGMLVLDGDVAADPADADTMRDHIADDPAAVWTAPARIWPRSTFRPAWHWAHWTGTPGQELTDSPRYWSLCFTYLPRALVEHCLAAKPRGLADWTYPRVDAALADHAHRQRIRTRVAWGVTVKHCNW